MDRRRRLRSWSGKAPIKIFTGITLFTTISIFLFFSCTNPMKDTLRQVVHDFKTPQVVPVIEGNLDPYHFVNGSAIAQDTVIKVIFNKTMDISSVVCSGSLYDESDGGTWSNYERQNDAISFAPSTSWSTGTGKTFSMTGSDLEGNDMEPLSITYMVRSDNIMYVHNTLGNNINPGTRELSKKDIDVAVNYAAHIYNTSEVRVAEGTYKLYETLDMQEGVSLYGGYSAEDWDHRENDPFWAITGDFQSTYPTIIDSNTENGMAIHFSLITQTSYLDGFNIDISFADVVSAIYCSNASPVIRSNYINAKGSEASYGIALVNQSAYIEYNNINGGDLGDASAGIMISGGGDTPQIIKNIIDAGKSSTNGFTVGIFVESSSPIIAYNEIYGGIAGNNSVGIFVNSGSDIYIYNNVIDGGVSQEINSTTTGIVFLSGSGFIYNNTINTGLIPTYEGYEVGISCLNDASTTIENNIIFSAPEIRVSLKHGVEAQLSAFPDSMKNNNIFNLADALFFISEDNIITTITEVNNLTFASGNISVDAGFVDMNNQDYHLTPASPVDVRQGGLDLSLQFINDKDDVSRTADTSGGPSNDGAAGWSMGAYEQ